MPMRAALLPGLMILSSLSLTGCAPQRLACAAPPHLLTCADEPLAPDLPPPGQQLLRDALMIEYTLGLRSACWDSCHAAVAGIRAWAASPRR